ncbi:hypothetical protein FH972_013464 [Carpinus fangiana]|uniref:Uncharacterized protein n=1 Tax=Carpinus fangiana TaxID=176857 RepID=A0A5N6RA98_9ROSI|nr:hypothetical protein FH972_013464 [Carpinus fangiana]
MEANKERREQVEKKKVDDGRPDQSATETPAPAALDPTAKTLIRESIITEDGGGGKAADDDDVLAFSRSVHKIDSSLE